ncbi:outer membrane lipoprotein-sorting protein [Cellulophaga baltica]|uniref:outer membrane lipoprotein-sorting protein n=1 Tax=Cellulophaga TaxID=104264 RepID=UPI001C075424|nr:MULTISPECIES: outer membrane lipoprotein-sorting protein [Cellulophaga]MBU2995533.1 outer membrane lipoprotein-sorting protein [Cellulophaga baltica]MDO6766927.1 outer membrane lipoprotein-sorting protein [Cellulophaga sp. 1_MG-2023]
MKTLKLCIAVFFIAISTSLQAQTADEIISNYFENIGGLDKLSEVQGMKMIAKVNQQGMEIPLEIIQLKEGKQVTLINFQGKEIKQNAFDGETLWSHNFMTMKAEKSDAEATSNFKLNVNDFPDSFIDYKDKGYTVELLGKETIDGAETFKIKLVKEPILVDGKKEEDISFYYFDAENYVPIAIHSEIKTGPGKGMTSEVTMSDYQEVDGLYFPYAITQGVKGQPGSPVTISSIELNPEIGDEVFTFPDVIETEE